ncbi:MAG: ATP-dependent RecD-like DNA helicase [Planctomycetes bacterium]|nr:ATP-dependent RecD-like DNA helicase [Planctomycetota bacterium]
MAPPPHDEKQASLLEVRLEGELRRFVYESPDSDFRVAELATRQGPIRISGSLLGARPGEALRIVGIWVEHPQYGRQLKLKSAEVVPPTTRSAIEAYLASGLVKGIGPAKAASIVERFGEDTLRVLEEEPRRLAEIPGIGAKRVAAIAAAVKAQRGLRDLVAFLGQHQVTPRAALRIWDHYGPDSLRLVRENPYRLAEEVYGFGFRKADDIARKLGLPADSPQRIRAGLAFVLSDAGSEGHVCLPKEELIARAARVLSIDDGPVRESLQSAADDEELILETKIAKRGAPPEQATEPLVYLPHLLEAERTVAKRIRALLHSPMPPPIADAGAVDAAAARAGLALHGQQRAAVASALRERIQIITGGPGVGKTTIVRLIVDLALRAGRSVLLASPTGRAARRLSEATSLPASTLHRLLEFQPRDGTFQRGEHNPLDASLLVVDEASMIDLPLASHLLRAVQPPTRLVIVGDSDQLPSVGPGAFLHDLIASERVPVARLTQVFRQGSSSGIVTGAHAILRGEIPEFAASPTGGGDLFFLEREDPLDALKTVLYVVTERIPQAFRLDPRSDIQVIAPMYRGEVGVDRLNREIRARLNPPPAGKEDEPVFREHDRVLVTKNDAEREVYNGDVGRVLRAGGSDRKVTVDFGGGRILAFDVGQQNDLVPAYAISVHRSQGSEYPAVVIPLSTQHFVMLRRTLLYTAVTRARKICVLVGSRRALEIAVRDPRREERCSLLTERVLSEL